MYNMQIAEELRRIVKSRIFKIIGWLF